ncbi:MAG TPA: DedA family protein [Gaiellaceae bacterium]|nr:DedA family protein [Gaiellaceae bacterium]
MITAALVDVPPNIGYPLLFALVAAESAGALVPGETALIVAGALAAQGRLELPLVVLVAATAAIVGDNLGYTLGRRGLRPLLDRPGRWSTRRQRLIARSEAYFRRYGPATVFVGRWLPGLRVFASWLAGADRMPWPRFLLWNALGGIAWAITIGTAGYLIGRSVSGSLGLIGLAGLALVTAAYLVFRIRERRAPGGPGRGDR